MTETLEALNAAGAAEFVACLGDIFEHAPWVADRAAALRPFATVAELHQAMMQAAQTASAGERLAFLRGHPELAGEAARRSTMAAHSIGEQASLGLGAPGPLLAATFDRLNAAYRARFGFPFIICVRRHTLGSIIARFEARLANPLPVEEQAAFAEIGHITWRRLADLVQGPGKPVNDGSLTTHVLNTVTGRPAMGMAIDLFECHGDHRILIASRITNPDGRTDAPLIEKAGLRIGDYELRFAVGAYFTDVAGPDSFLSIVPIRFQVHEPETHYHVPLLVSPGAYATYRGS